MSWCHGVKASLACGLVCLGVATTGHAQSGLTLSEAGSQAGLGPYAHAGFQAWSNGMPVLAMDGDWQRGYQRRAGTQRAYQVAQAEAGVLWAPEFAGRTWPMALGAVVRAQALAMASGEAAQVVYHYQSQTDPAQPGHYDGRTHVMSWVGRGLAWRLSPLSSGPLQMELGWQWLTLTRVRDVATAGQATYNADGSYDFDVSVRHDRSGFQPRYSRPPEPQGEGASLSLAWLWRATPQLTMSLKLDDIWSRLRWQGLNGDDAVASSNVATRTTDGYLDYQPVVQGQYTRRGFSHSIPATVDVTALWHAGPGTAMVNLNRRWGLQQAWLGWRSLGTWRWQAAVEPWAQAWQVGLDAGGFSARFQTDRLDQAAHVRSWSLGYTWQR